MNKPEKPTPFEQSRNAIRAQRDKIYREIEALRNKIAGLDEAINILEAEEHRARQERPGRG